MRPPPARRSRRCWGGSRPARSRSKTGSRATPIRSCSRIEADPTEPALYVQLAGVYRRHNQPDRARAVLQQGLGPTGNAFQLQLELMELDLAPVRKNLELAEARIQRLKEKLPSSGDETGKGTTMSRRN